MNAYREYASVWYRASLQNKYRTSLGLRGCPLPPIERMAERDGAQNRQPRISLRQRSSAPKRISSRARSIKPITWATSYDFLFTFLPIPQSFMLLNCFSLGSIPVWTSASYLILIGRTNHVRPAPPSKSSNSRFNLRLQSRFSITHLLNAGSSPHAYQHTTDPNKISCYMQTYHAIAKRVSHAHQHSAAPKNTIPVFDTQLSPHWTCFNVTSRARLAPEIYSFQLRLDDANSIR
jgi:hypothetical protein